MIVAVDDVEAIRRGVLAALPGNLGALIPPGHVTGASDTVKEELERFLSLLAEYPNRAGKGLRGQLLLLSARAHGVRGHGKDDDAGAQAARVLAEALELFQNWVLVHDDIEDDSDERRGQPALHRQTGMPVALNVGDAMHVAMWQHLMSLPAGRYDRAGALSEFGRMIVHTAAGQHLDLAWVAQRRFDVTEDDYLAMVSLKTAYYTVVSPLRLGAYAAGAEPSELLERAGLDLGVAFQIRDDVLNLSVGAEVGKEFAGDLYEGKRTLVLAHLLATAPQAVRQRVVALLDRPRRAKQPEEMDEVLRMMVEHGSLEYAQGVAEERLRRGLDVLERALAPLPDQASAARILALVSELAARPY